MKTAQDFNNIGAGMLPGYLGIEMLQVGQGEVLAQMPVKQCHMAPNGYLHAASLVALADTSCGNGTLASLPEGATGFTTIELKSNHLGTVREGTVECRATAIHQGRITQVWDAEVISRETQKTLAHFRCTQMVLYR